ncbi:hypothetical protein ANANG_G00179560, partial [Anguilla anguilla]
GSRFLLSLELLLSPQLYACLKLINRALQHKESACLNRHAQLCGYSDCVAACSNFIPSNMPTRY